jgi:hypothetical protein
MQINRFVYAVVDAAKLANQGVIFRAKAEDDTLIGWELYR